MRNLLNNADQATLLGNLYCDADHVTELITAEEKVMLRRRCAGDGINVIDCHYVGVEEFIHDAGSLDFNSKVIDGSSPLVAQNIPVIPREWFSRPSASIDSEIVGIRLSDILSRQPTRRWGVLTLGDDVHIDLSVLESPIFERKNVVLFASGEDVVIESLWWRRHAIGLFEALASGNFYAVTGMNFSLFLHECPLAHLLNLNKSLLFSEELCKVGVPVIPHVYAVNEQQRAKWVDFLNQRPNIATVVINTQLQRDRYSMREAERTALELISKTHVNVILNGRRPYKKSLAPHLGKRIFIANQQGLKKQAIIEAARLRTIQQSNHKVLELS